MSRPVSSSTALAKSVQTVIKPRRSVTQTGPRARYVPPRPQVDAFGCRSVSHSSAASVRCRRLTSPVQRLQTRRSLSSTPIQCAYKTVQEARSKYSSGPFSWKAGVLFLLTGAGLIVYFRQEKARMERKRIAEATKGIGKPKVGGPFELVDHNGDRFTSEDMKGKYALVYFGFTHCPDICPEELDKMARIIDLVKEKAGNVMRSVFVTCDPARDKPPVLKSYLNEFHPDLLGLTGEYDQIKSMCKAYRVYFSTPPNVKPDQDYLVDHSIYFYLMDPEGDFVEAIGRQDSAPQAGKVITQHINDWKGRIDRN